MPEYRHSSILRDPEGYLVDPQDWSETLAVELAAEEDIQLDAEYWTALRFMRAYHEEHGIAPDVRHLIAHLAGQRGCSKKQAKARLFELFPYGYVKQACKIAGMMRPRAWSTG
jgi:tRNA 2-thiouridine synthesizing protein E